jgi:hypothetical protein
VDQLPPGLVDELDTGARILPIHMGALIMLGIVNPVLMARTLIRGGVAGSVAPVSAVMLTAAAAITIAAVALDIRIKLVGFLCVAAYVITEGLGFSTLLICVLAQPRRFDLGLLGISPGPRGLCFAFPRVEFLVLCLAANLSGLLAVRVVPLLLHRLPAAPCCKQQQHNQHHYNNGDYHPNPRSCFQITHHFPLRRDRAGESLSG